ncbi:hypothetical protein [Brachybacterium alimentarium]|uniref:hypothetical protein n=1 Tax=Brachybacterium alimentarium TaxID=47845 RepID=UPI000DF3515D|nr:hypothetical protein [Brachybacterium alimentarium]RCS77480.1 hypothetical protein CIK68_00505 [Brachybacterium alimentarium]RCS85312.1 hypothetical protein CIK67_08235 [Brachybacterium alimentarium]
MRSILLPTLPTARIHVLRVIVYAFVILDILTLSGDVVAHAGNAEYYTPLLLARILHLPAVTSLVAQLLRALIIVACVAAVAGVTPRITGAVVAIGYWVWMLYSQGYGYVAHDHMALMVAVAVLPTVATPPLFGDGGPAGSATGRPAGSAADGSVGAGTVGEEPRSEAAGWALRCIQIAVVATYFFSIVPKILYTGSLAAWANSAILTWASLRRGSVLAHWLVENVPWIFVPAQWGGVALEALSPVVLFLRGRALYVAIAVYMSFHLATLVLLGIHFLPTVICWAAFLPLERWRELGRGRRPRRQADQPGV